MGFRFKWELAYAELRRRILELELPPGAAVGNRDVASALGISRAPLRVALALLAEEGLVDIRPQHGSHVAPIRPDDVRESLFIRTALEVEAARRAAARADRGLSERLAENLVRQGKALRAGDLHRCRALGEQLHEMIVSSVAGERARHQWRAAMSRLARAARMTPPERDAAKAALAEHRRLVEAIGAGSPALAAAAMRAHLSRTAAALERAIAGLS